MDCGGLPAEPSEPNSAQGVVLVNQNPLPDARGIRRGACAAPRVTPLRLVRKASSLLAPRTASGSCISFLFDLFSWSVEAEYVLQNLRSLETLADSRTSFNYSMRIIC